jgi:hypothetical protein
MVLFAEEHAMISQGYVLAIASAIFPAIIARLPVSSIIPRFRWTSFAGGVSISFVFLGIFREPNNAKEKLQHREVSLVHHLKNHIKGAEGSWYPVAGIPCSPGRTTLASGQ